ncbi:relaxase domain-containing protein [Streptosporangium sp. LJ11]|uniref:relaxase domain-containing protein n=1 Tax=Streptosporangium sp. LJ11 TaxID=3436927 RepID=UPI003F7AADFE
MVRTCTATPTPPTPSSRPASGAGRPSTVDLRLRWERDAHTDAWKIVGIDEAMRTRFSKRDGQIKELPAEHGLTYEETHPHARKVAAAWAASRTPSHRPPTTKGPSQGFGR